MYGISIRRKKEPSGVPDASSCPAINNSERKFGAIADLRLIQDADVAILEEFGLLLQLLQNLTAAVDAIQFLAPGFAHLEEFFFLVDAPYIPASIHNEAMLSGAWTSIAQ